MDTGVRVISFPERDLGDGYFCVRYSHTWVLYHKSEPRKALWEDYEVVGCKKYISTLKSQGDLLRKHEAWEPVEEETPAREVEVKEIPDCSGLWVEMETNLEEDFPIFVRSIEDRHGETVFQWKDSEMNSFESIDTLKKGQYVYLDGVISSFFDMVKGQSGTL